MKKTLLMLSVVLMLLAFISCSANVEDKGTSVLNLSLNSTSPKGLGVSRTPISGVTYKATFTQENGSSLIRYNGELKDNGVEFALSGTSSAIELSYGKWTLVVNGYVNGNKVYTSKPEQTGSTTPTDITFTINSSRIGSITTTGVGATVDEGSNTLKVSVRNIKEGTVTVTRDADAAITGVNGSSHELKWYVSTDYVTFSDWTSSTVFNAGTTYWVRCNAVDKTDSTLVYATATTAAFSLYYGEKANISGSLDPNTGAFNLQLGDEATNKYKVIYLANGGTGTVTDETLYDKGTSTTVKVGVPLTRAFYAFDGWNTAPDGSGTSYAAGASLTVNKETVLYAQWKKISVESITLSPTAKNLVSSKVPVAVKSTNWTGLGLDAPVVKYTGREGTTYAESTTKPTENGKYTATMTVGGKSVTMDFEI